MSNKEYSQRELELIGHFRPDLVLYADTFTPYVLYRMCVEHVFCEDLKGPAVDALRRAYIGLGNKVYRMTPEFEALLIIN